MRLPPFSFAPAGRACFPRRSWAAAAVLLLWCAAPTTLRADESRLADDSALAKEYAATVQPLVTQFCLDCHSTAAREGELDLERFATLAEVRRAAEVWQQVVQMIDDGQMPPEDAVPRPTAEQRQQLLGWAQRFLDAEALARAGDPGPVVLRRLNNAQYTYTVRDLTGVPLDPAAEFPVDGAAGEGFTNTGNSLVMSPALLAKYLEAGKEIAAHAVPLPDGFRFSASQTPRDWTNESLARIRDFYRQFTEPRGSAGGSQSGGAAGGTQVNLQGIQFETNTGGRLPLEPYLSATLSERDALRSGEKAIADVAREHALNAKYLGILWTALNANEPSWLLDAVRARWREADVQDAAALAAEISTLQEALFRFSSVGHIGKVGGPTAWQEPLTPLAARQELRLKLPATQSQSGPQEVVLYLVAGDAGDGSRGDYAVWERPRIVRPDQSELLLRDLPDSLQSPSGQSQSGRFGLHPDGSAIDPASLCVAAPAVLEVRIPAELAAGAELVTSGTLHETTGGEGSVQFQVLLDPPPHHGDSNPGDSNPGDSLRLSLETPVITRDGSRARQRFEAAFEDFRNLFPAALCYMKIVPVDEVVTLTLFHREDEPLRRLMLSDAESRELDQLWEELHFVSRDAITLVDAFEQLLEYASQDGDPAVFEPLRKPIEQRAARFRQTLLEAEPRQLEAVVDFAARVYRRPLVDAEKERLRDLYRQLRDEGLSHDEAFRFTLARLFVSPAFLYRLEQPPPGDQPGPVSDWELASRLSYFLWASQPDEELFAVAAAGTLRQPEVLAAQSQRMLRSPRIRRLATEFACQWLQIYELDGLDEKSRSHFPEFEELRGDLYEEAIRFFTDFFQHDGSVLSLLDADHTFVNERLARFYGLPWDAASSAGEWRRVEGLRQHGRGGILGLGATLAKHSGASRSSPILRGIWVSESLLGEKLPDPPPGVPPFPDSGAATANLTVRQITELHTSHADCAGCHRRVDPFGFALEQFDAIGRFRERDSGGRTLDTRARLPDGREVEGLSGLRTYLLDHRRDAVLEQFCRKLLGYALGRSVQLSDQPLLAEMQQQLAAHDYRVSAAVSAILHSRQFQQIRGVPFPGAE